MSDEDYSNLDLDTAEQLLIAAGRPELAQALGYHKDGIRNLVQGEWGKSFVASLEGLLVKHIDPLVAAQKETHSGIAALSGQFRELAETVDGLQSAMHESQADRQTLHTEIANLRASFEEYKAGSRRAEVDELRDQLREVRGDYTPEERTRLTGVLLRMIAEWEAAHGDGQ